jgi:hypothetical protein
MSLFEDATGKLKEFTEEEAAKYYESLFDLNKHPLVLGFNEMAKQDMNNPAFGGLLSSCICDKSYVDSVRFLQRKKSDKDVFVAGPYESVSKRYTALVAHMSEDVWNAIKRSSERYEWPTLAKDKGFIAELLSKKRYALVRELMKEVDEEALGSNPYKVDECAAIFSHRISFLEVVFRLSYKIEEDSLRSFDDLMIKAPKKFANLMVSNLNGYIKERPLHEFRSPQEVDKVVKWVERLGLDSKRVLDGWVEEGQYRNPAVLDEYLKSKSKEEGKLLLASCETPPSLEKWVMKHLTNLCSSYRLEEYEVEKIKKELESRWSLLNTALEIIDEPLKKDINYAETLSAIYKSSQHELFFSFLKKCVDGPEFRSSVGAFCEQLKKEGKEKSFEERAVAFEKMCLSQFSEISPKRAFGKRAL